MVTPYTPALGVEQDNVMAALQKCAGLRYEHGFDVMNTAGSLLTPDMRPIASSTGGAQSASINREAGAPVSGRYDFAIDTDLNWGLDIVAPYMLVSSAQYAGGTPQRFPLGRYVVTTPSVALREQKAWNASAYSLPYLLQSEIGDNYSAAPGSTYSSNIATLLVNAGIPNVLVSGALNPNVVRVTDPTWSTKVIPASGQGAGPLIFLYDDSNTYTYLDVINELLKASGQNPLSDDQNGRFLITPTIGVPNTEAIRWTFSVDPTTCDSDFKHTEKVISGSLSTDAWNLPNRAVYIQTGLTFDPTHSDGTDGRYVIDNVLTGNTSLDQKYYRPPGDQTSIGRIIQRTYRLEASGTADLIKRADQHYAELYSTAESFDLSTAPWPVAWERDTFRVASSYLPRVNQRKVQAQSWTLSLRGDPMSWKLNSVSEG